MRPVRVLIVEDSAADAALVLRQLRRAGFDPHEERVDSAAGFEEALSYGPWDVVIADHQIPGFGGLEALRMLKAHQLDIPFILTSGVVTEEVAVEAMRAGSHDYVLKQNLTRLGPAVARELDEAQARHAARAAAAEHARTQELLRAVLDAAPIALLAFDAKAELVLCEGAAMRGFGIAPGQRVHDWRRCLRRVPWLSEAIERAVRGEAMAMDGPFAHGWIEVHAAPVKDADGGPRGAIVIALDVSERKRFEQDRDASLRREQHARAEAEAAERLAGALAEAGRALAESLDETATRATVCRVALVADLVDAVALDEVGAHGPHRVAMRSHNGARATLTRFVGNDERGATTDLAMRALADGRALLEVEPRPSGTDDAAAPRALAVPLVSRGRVLGVLTFVAGTHVSPWSDADRRLLEELAGRCAQALDNAKLYGEAHAAIAKRDEFVAIASHELRTPLTTIELQLHLLQRKAAAICRDDPAREWLRARVRALYVQTANLNRLVHELLDVSRIMQRRVTIDLQTVDLAEVVREVVAALADRGAIARAGSVVDVVAPQPVRGRWDRMRVEQIVTNLLTNALKYGNGQPVRLEARGTHDVASLIVRDRGIGIAPEDQARIFERFERAVPQHNYGGLGVGLYIVRQLVEELGGTVHVDSAPAEGSTFTVTLPIEGPPARRGRGGGPSAPRADGPA